MTEKSMQVSALMALTEFRAHLVLLACIKSRRSREIQLHVSCPSAAQSMRMERETDWFREHLSGSGERTATNWQSGGPTSATCPGSISSAPGARTSRHAIVETDLGLRMTVSAKRSISS